MSINSILTIYGYKNDFNLPTDSHAFSKNTAWIIGVFLSANLNTLHGSQWDA